MDGVADEDLVVARGQQCTVAWARDAAGRRWAKEFLESKDVPGKDRARIERWCQVLAETGRICNQEQFKKEAGEIWTFKSYQVRIGAFRVGRVWYLTHGFIKKRDGWPRQQQERAERIRTEHMNRRSRR